jgi:glycosyltransferase involved in cell wall biosynthesis
LSSRVAVVTSSYPREPGDPAGHFVASEVTRFVRAGQEVHVFAPGTGPRSADGATLHWLADGGAFGWPGALSRLKQDPRRVFGASAFVLRAREALRKAGPFARVHAHFLLPCAWPIAALASSAELELVGHGSDVRLFCALPAALRAHVARGWLGRKARIRVTSSELARLLRAANPELSASLRVQASPTDLGAVPSRGEARRALGWDERPRALIVARLIPGKCVATALRALSLVAGVQAVVVGDGPELHALRLRFPAVQFTGRLPRPEALQLIAAADVLVSASPEEGAPSVVREARALGVRVVAVRAGELPAWAASDPGIRLV